MNLNLKFIDAVSYIMNISKEYGFNSAREWASKAYEVGEISYEDLKQYEQINNLRNMIVHGKAESTEISVEIYDFAVKMKKTIINSKLRKEI